MRIAIPPSIERWDAGYRSVGVNEATRPQDRGLAVLKPRRPEAHPSAHRAARVG